MMKTITPAKLNNTHRLLAVMFVLCALLLTFCLTAKPSHAESTYTLSGEYTLDSNYTDVTALPSDLSTTFKLYKVGHFVSGEPFVELDSPYDEKSLGPIPVKKASEVSSDNEVEWTKECLAYANTLANYVPDSPDYTIDVNADGTFSKSGIPNGIYLLKGDSQLVKDYPEEGKESYWWPQPMLISILNSDVHVNVKPMTELVTHCMVRKVWDNEPADKDGIRPASITVKIYYDTKDADGLRYTEKLNEDNDWCFKWDPAKGEGDPSKWMVEEVTGSSDADSAKLKNYKVSIGTKFIKESDGDTEVVTITNTYVVPPTTTTETTSPSTTTPHDKNHKTGDSFSYIKYIVLMAAALIALILILFNRRKRKDENRA